MKSLPRTKEVQFAETVLIEVMRIAKINNPASVFGIGEEDMNYLIDSLAGDYLFEDFARGKKILDVAVTQFFSLSQKESKINIGDFMRLCYAEKRVLDENTRTQNLIMPKKNLSETSASKQNITLIKEMLAKTVTELPYSQTIRMNSDGTENKAFKEPLKQKYGGIGDGSELMGAKELKAHLHGKRMELHNDLASYGTLVHFEDVKNPELQALYYKAWTDGITQEEKLLFNQLAREA